VAAQLARRTRGSHPLSRRAACRAWGGLLDHRSSPAPNRHANAGPSGIRHAPYVVDWRPGLRAWSANDDFQAAVLTRADGTELFTGSNGTGPVRFSPDGQYLATLDDTTGDTGASDAAAPLIVDTTDGSSWRLVTSATGASVGWGYGHTLMYLQSGGTGQFDDQAPLLVHDPAARRVVAVEHRGEVVLPAG